MFAAAAMPMRCHVTPTRCARRAGRICRDTPSSSSPLDNFTAPTAAGAAHRAQRAVAITADAAADDDDDEASGAALFLFGFHEDEVEPLAELVGALAEEMEVCDVARGLAVSRVAGDALALSAEVLLGIQPPPPSSSCSREGVSAAEGDGEGRMDEGGDEGTSPPSSPGLLPPAARCVLLWGAAARALMPDLRFEMYHAGFGPSVFGAFTAAHRGKPLVDVAAAVVKAHERYWDLAGDPGERAGGGGGGGGDGTTGDGMTGDGTTGDGTTGDGTTGDETTGDGTTGDSSAGDALGEPPRIWAVPTAWAGEEGWKAADVTVAMAVAVDRATVPDPPASEEALEEDDLSDGTREDVSNIVALDGVVGDALRGALLDAVTQVGWPHDTATAPPTPKWERETNDGISDDNGDDNGDGGGGGGGGGGRGGGQQLRVPPSSWGLSEEALHEVGRSAPVRAFLARLGAMYPEYHVRTMPADALEPDGIPGAMSSARDGGNSRVATVVANAAVYGDDFQWHLDMDPASLDPTSPFAERYGNYVNRSVGRPLFVSALVYLNGPKPWIPGMDAETLFLDPGTGTGVFVRPAPGRVLLMDQDVLHRVSTPSQSAGVPRYSLVLKLCFYPKDADGGKISSAAVRPTVARTEWGVPLNFGTAGGRSAPPHLLGEVYHYDEACEEEFD